MANIKTVLVVDDSKMSRMMIRKIISTHYPEWTIIEAENGAKALQVCQGQAIDIMTLDMNMPGMDGVTLGTKLRILYPNADISLVTANVQGAVKDKAKAARMQFVPKPITEERIMGYIRAVA